MEYVTVKMTKEAYDSCESWLPPHEIKLIKSEGHDFSGDSTHAALKKASHKAYKDLQDYEFQHTTNK